MNNGVWQEELAFTKQLLAQVGRATLQVDSVNDRGCLSFIYIRRCSNSDPFLAGMALPFLIEGNVN